jgi:hypothetical protein
VNQHLSASRNSLLARAHIAAQDLGMDEETRRDFIAARFQGRRSCSELHDHELRRLMDHFREKGWRGSRKGAKDAKERPDGRYMERLAHWQREFPMHRAGMATPAQLAHIEARWEGIAHGPNPGARAIGLRRFLFKRFGVQDLRFLDHGTAVKVIDGMKAMGRRSPQANADGGREVYC